MMVCQAQDIPVYCRVNNCNNCGMRNGATILLHSITTSSTIVPNTFHLFIFLRLVDFPVWKLIDGNIIHLPTVKLARNYKLIL